jgi:hypothetical protein
LGTLGLGPGLVGLFDGVLQLGERQLFDFALPCDPVLFGDVVGVGHCGVGADEGARLAGGGDADNRLASVGEDDRTRSTLVSKNRARGGPANDGRVESGHDLSVFGVSLGPLELEHLKGDGQDGDLLGDESRRWLKQVTRALKTWYCWVTSLRCALICSLISSYRGELSIRVSVIEPACLEDGALEDADAGLLRDQGLDVLEPSAPPLRSVEPTRSEYAHLVKASR